MERRQERRRWFFFFAVVGGFLFLLIGLYVRMVHVRERAFKREVTESRPLVRVMEPHPTTAIRTVTVLGRFMGQSTIQVFADAGGWVNTIPVVEGTHVKKSDVLMILKDERRILALKEAKARLKSAEALLRKLHRQLEQTQTLYQEGIVAEDAYLSLKDQTEAQEATVESLKATVARLQWDVEHLVIRAPFDGIVTEILPDVGQEVAPGTPVIRMVSTKSYRIEAGVEARVARQLEPDMRVTLLYHEGETFHEIPGRIRSISPQMDPASATFKVVIIPETNEKARILPGEMVYVQVPLEILQNMIIVNREIVMSDEFGTFIFVYRDGKAHQTPVDVIWLNEKQGAIPFDQIPKNSTIIIEGHSNLSDGEEVRVESPKPSETRG